MWAGSEKTRSILVVGCIHGNEPAGRVIVEDLARSTPAPETELLLVRDLNPDGFAHRVRTNAHGVDLNRNSPEHWAGAGARPWSEPETRAIRDLILGELPVLSIYYHQPFGLVDVPEGGRPQAARRYAELTGLPLHRLSRRPGSISRWQNVTRAAGLGLRRRAGARAAAGRSAPAPRRGRAGGLAAIRSRAPGRPARAAPAARARGGTSSSRP